jgi:hypothetical protein
VTGESTVVVSAATAAFAVVDCVLCHPRRPLFTVHLDVQAVAIERLDAVEVDRAVDDLRWRGGSQTLRCPPATIHQS